MQPVQMNGRKRRRFPWNSPKLAVAVAGALMVVAGGTPTAAAGENADPYAADPLGLIAHYDLTTELGTTPDMYEVWICQITTGPFELSVLTPETSLPFLQNQIAAYWAHASAGIYTVSFMVGGTVRDPRGGCASAVREQSTGGPRAVMILEANSHYPIGGSGIGSSGFSCFDNRAVWWCDTTYPANNRYALVHIGEGAHIDPPLSAIVHEMGHTLGFPHSYTGQLPVDHPRREYDNPMDVMSGGASAPHAVGMIAPNRYAAGWIPTDQVHLYDGGTEQVTLQNYGHGVLMLAIPDGRGRWLSVAARVASNYNDAPANGVELYVVDETPSACGNIRSPCWGVNRKTTPHSTDSTDLLGHVLVPGEKVTWNNTTITVHSAAAADGGYMVTVTDSTGTTGSGRFIDDNGNIHEPDIEHIAALGITQGCATTPAMYCPDRTVTRAEMAAFLLRATNRANPIPARTHTFTDVADGVWYTNYVHAFAETGVDPGQNGQWRPDDPLTRLEMAYWLAGIFNHITPTSAPLGLFSDVNQNDWVVVEGLHQAGITKGCSAAPLLYCPDQPVTRAQMASFITRSLRG